ncbi:Cof-type HAD-IIB family hydrolase [Pediococcus siamensis]|uniref:Cof-type HAD-IIB family hydrolase n=1 Tax=Pediococcus siamensis TaxID=381829 RepID=UPI0039A04BC9
MKKYKAVVFFDLDKTLLNPEKHVYEANIKAVNQLKHNNVLPVISTGKNQYELGEIIKESGIQTVIGSNGADLFIGNRHIYQQPISTEVLEEISFCASNDNVALAYHSSDGVAVTLNNKYTESLFTEMHRPIPMKMPNFYRINPVLMLLVFIPRSSPELENKYRKKFTSLNFMRNSEVTIDTVNQNVSKAYGIRKLLSMAELSGAKSFAFGDGNNDISMLKIVDTGIAMGNSVSGLLSVADYKTDDYRNNGIPKALSHFKLI